MADDLKFASVSNSRIICGLVCVERAGFYIGRRGGVGGVLIPYPKCSRGYYRRSVSYIENPTPPPIIHTADIAISINQSTARFQASPSDPLYVRIPCSQRLYPPTQSTGFDIVSSLEVRG